MENFFTLLMEIGIHFPFLNPNLRLKKGSNLGRGGSLGTRNIKKFLCIFAWFRACFDIHFWKWEKMSIGKAPPPRVRKFPLFFLFFLNPSLSINDTSIMMIKKVLSELHFEAGEWSVRDPGSSAQGVVTPGSSQERPLHWSPQLLWHGLEEMGPWPSSIKPELVWVVVTDQI